MVIVDASVWIDWDRGISNPQTRWLRQAANAKRAGLTDLILFELLRGCRDDRQAARLHEGLRRFALQPGGGEPVAQGAAAYYRLLRQDGITVASAVDCLTAAFCIQHRHELLHRDHDYDAFEGRFGLRVIHPD